MTPAGRESGDTQDRARQVRLVPPTRPVIAFAVLFAALALVLAFAADVLLVTFAGLLFGVFLEGGGGWIARRLGIPRGWGVALFVLLCILALSGAFLGFAPAAAEQFDRLAEDLPQAIEALRARLEEYA